MTKRGLVGRCHWQAGLHLDTKLDRQLGWSTKNFGSHLCIKCPKTALYAQKMMSRTR